MNLQNLLTKKYSKEMLESLDISEWSEWDKKALECLKEMKIPLDYEKVIKQHGIEVFKSLALSEIDSLVKDIKKNAKKQAL